MFIDLFLDDFILFGVPLCRWFRDEYSSLLLLLAGLMIILFVVLYTSTSTFDGSLWCQFLLLILTLALRRRLGFVGLYCGVSFLQPLPSQDIVLIILDELIMFLPQNLLSLPSGIILRVPLPLHQVLDLTAREGLLLEDSLSHTGERVIPLSMRDLHI